MKIYVASSWRNKRQQAIVVKLRYHGHQVYDFKHPAPGDNGFHWSEIDPNWKLWRPKEFREALNHDTAEHGFANDFMAMMWADAVLLVQPCGRSAHLELGWASGKGKLSVVLLEPDQEPELMYKLADFICTSDAEMIELFELFDVDPKFLANHGAAGGAQARYRYHKIGIYNPDVAKIGQVKQRFVSARRKR